VSIADQTLVVLLGDQLSPRIAALRGAARKTASSCRSYERFDESEKQAIAGEAPRFLDKLPGWSR
jgi:hypothetical protein